MVACWWRMLEVGGLFLYSKEGNFTFTSSLFHFYFQNFTLFMFQCTSLCFFFFSNEVKFIERMNGCFVVLGLCSCIILIMISL